MYYQENVISSSLIHQQYKYNNATYDLDVNSGPPSIEEMIVVVIR